MEGKKPESLSGHISDTRKYDKPNVPEEKAPQEIEKLKEKLENFKKTVLKKFPFIKSIGLLPAKAFPMFEEEEIPPEMQEEIKKEKPLHLIIVIPEDEYKNLPKIKPEIVKIAKESGEKLWVHIKTEVDLWNYGLDSRFNFIDAISACMPLHDTGFLGALRVANIHKSLVLNRFDKYIASYCIGGSLVRGTAGPDSDVDVFIVIDDTDVKRMTRIELLERLRGIIYDYIREATALAGVKNKLEPQVYLLTDFWQGVKDANPVYFTFIRDGVPFYDRGTFLPWKRLLLMGKIKPSPEAIDQYIKEGDKTQDYVRRRLIDTMIDLYYGVLTPTQALMMLSGHAPEVPKMIVSQVKEILVDKEKVMGEKELKILEKAVKYFKDYEHGKLKEISGKEIDELRKDFEFYSKRIKEIREKLEIRMQEHLIDNLHSEMDKLLKTIFGNKSQTALIEDLEKELIKKGKLPQKMLEIAKEILKIKVKMKNKKLTQTELHKISSDSNNLIAALVEYTQRKDLVSSQKGVISILYGEKKAEMVLTDSAVFFIEENKIKKITPKGLHDSNKNELEEAIKKSKENLQMKLDSNIILALKKEIGDFELSL